MIVVFGYLILITCILSGYCDHHCEFWQFSKIKSFLGISAFSTISCRCAATVNVRMNLLVVLQANSCSKNSRKQFSEFFRICLEGIFTRIAVTSLFCVLTRGFARALKISKMKSFATTVNDLNRLTITRKPSILDVFGGPSYVCLHLLIHPQALVNYF